MTSPERKRVSPGDAVRESGGGARPRPVDVEGELARLHDRSAGWALSLVGWNEDEAADLLQAVYVKVLGGRARFEGRSQFSTWLFGVLRKTAAERRRKHLRRRLLLLAHPDSFPVSRAASEGISIEAARLRRSLMDLPRRQREVLHLVFYSELSIREASEVMGVKLGTARVHYERGKKRLREKLGQPAPCEEDRDE